MVVLSNTRQGLQMKIRKLEQYFDMNKLIVHLDKTKVIVFRKGGKLPNNTTFKYKGQDIEVVNEYIYLGVPFSSSREMPRWVLYGTLSTALGRTPCGRN
jgi:hypothetical protein